MPPGTARWWPYAAWVTVVTPPGIRVTALAVVIHPTNGSLLVARHTSWVGTPFDRPPGGGVEFGEPARDAIHRELREELGVEAAIGERLGVLENLFTVGGRTGHELVVVHAAHFADAAAYDTCTGPVLDSPHEVLHWRPKGLEPPVPLYPEGIAELLGWRP